MSDKNKNLLARITRDDSVSVSSQHEEQATLQYAIGAAKRVRQREIVDCVATHCWCERPIDGVLQSGSNVAVLHHTENGITSCRFRGVVTEDMHRKYNNG